MTIFYLFSCEFFSYYLKLKYIVVNIFALNIFFRGCKTSKNKESKNWIYDMRQNLIFDKILFLEA